MRNTSAETLEFRSLIALVGRYVASPQGKAELEAIAPHTDRARLEEDLAEAGEAIDYLRAVAPTHAVPIHQAIVDPSARGIYYGRLTEMTDTDFQVLEPENGTQF